MGFSKFAVITLLATTLAALVESQGNCPFECSSKGSQKKFNVILKDGVSAESHFNLLTNCCKKSVKHISTEDFTQEFGENDIRDFSVEGALNGYTAFFDPTFVNDNLKKLPEVEVAEEDAQVSIHKFRTTIRKNPIFNLDRIDQAKFPLDKKYEFPATAGRGVDIYIVDTGIMITHEEFEGRARHGGSFCAGCGKTDGDGHGSHVAGTSAGKTFGVANRANLIAVKVLNDQGTGEYSEVIAGLTFVLKSHKSKPKQSSIVSMSLGGGKDDALNAVVKKLTDNGVHVVVAAGNDAGDACEGSPSSAPSAITVGATDDISDHVADFSNVGKCLDIFAPGVNVKSVGIKSNNDTAVLSGTSMSTPHVTGTLALIIGQLGNASADQIAKTLNNIATKGVIPKADLRGSPNVFLRVPFNSR